MTDTWIDGGGVVADSPLPEGAWIRFVLNRHNRSKDIVASVKDGKLHIRAPYRMIDTEQTAVNSLDVVPMDL